MKSKIIYRIVDILCIAVLLGTVIWLIAIWDKIPDEIPMHFNAAGEIDRMDSKSGILLMPIFSWILYVIMVVVEHIPGAWNTGVKVTPKNSARVYGILKRMLVILKVLLVLLFTLITIFIVRGENMPVIFLPIELGAIFGTIIWHLISLYKNQ